jgi:hypothetical protein
VNGHARTGVHCIGYASLACELDFGAKRINNILAVLSKPMKYCWPVKPAYASAR